MSHDRRSTSPGRYARLPDVPAQRVRSVHLLADAAVTRRMARRTLLAQVAAGVAISSVATNTRAQAQEATTVRDTYWRRCHRDIRRVVDGDTVDVVLDLGFGLRTGYDSTMPMRLRLLGLNTAEIRGGTPVTREQAADARLYVLAWFGTHQHGTSEWPFNVRTEKDDSFGRYLAEIECEQGHSLNAELLAAGLAVPYP